MNNMVPQHANLDSLSFVCNCSASSAPNGGLVLLFYRYYAASPCLPDQPPENNPALLAQFHQTLTKKLSLGGKIRVATEGFNITVGGTKNSIKEYMLECVSHWSFQGLELSTEGERKAFFKPSEGGCACAFDGASIRVASEITPMGVTNYAPRSWDEIDVLSPEEFHERCHLDPNTVLLDVRNHYESRIGFFVNPKTGETALRPPIRRFSQWPQYVRKYMGDQDKKMNPSTNGKQYLTFCTGGIRCEKGARYMQENMAKQPGDSVATLKGGIAAYLTWMDEEIKQGRKKPNDSLFKGKNYVFDARGSTALNEGSEPVSQCHGCRTASDRLSKCCSKGCHLILVVCEACEKSTNVRCCQSCLDIEEMSSDNSSHGHRPICTCEQERETLLWGEGSRKLPKTGKNRKSGNAKASAKAPSTQMFEVTSALVPMPKLAPP
jgi:predicted sulfurtransferase